MHKVSFRNKSRRQLNNLMLILFSSTVSWLLLSEIFPAGITGRAFSIVTVLNWGTNLLVSLTFLDMLSKYRVVSVDRSLTPHPYWRTMFQEKDRLDGSDQLMQSQILANHGIIKEPTHLSHRLGCGVLGVLVIVPFPHSVQKN